MNGTQEEDRYQKADCSFKCLKKNNCRAFSINLDQNGKYQCITYDQTVNIGVSPFYLRHYPAPTTTGNIVTFIVHIFSAYILQTQFVNVVTLTQFVTVMTFTQFANVMTLALFEIVMTLAQFVCVMILLIC